MAGSTANIIEIDRADPILFTAVGMVCSLGLDAPTSCAAARATIRRAQQIDTLRSASLDGRSVEPAIGHLVPIITHGLEGVPRLAQLAAAALRDLTKRFSIPRDRSIGFYLSMPSCRRHLTGGELIPDPDAKRAFLGALDEKSIGLDDQTSTKRVLELAVQEAGVPADIPLRFVTYTGHSGFAEALSVAVKDIRRKSVDLALVGGIDSLVEERALKWLKLTGRLKSDANPVGLEPGEGAAFLALGQLPERGQGKGLASCGIRRIAIADEDRCRIDGGEPTGRALSRCIVATIDVSEDLWLIADHNGETARAMEFGNAVMLVSNHNRNRLPPLLLAVPFGDTGAASGAVAACVAHTAFVRRYAPTHSAVIASMDDGRQRSAVCITRVQGS